MMAVGGCRFAVFLSDVPLYLLRLSNSGQEFQEEASPALPLIDAEQMQQKPSPTFFDATTFWENRPASRRGLSLF